MNFTRFELRAWYNPNLETRWNMIPGLIGTLTMLQTLLLAAMSVAREREQGTFDQLLVTPFRIVYASFRGIEKPRDIP